ncbi:Transmembrane protein of unknown function [Georgenia satyanarayanai]|uniref:DUF3566 domain-containing protein n=1 Tax=Georgenia satyanarayanai TaxID=860221 RepID=A0A2Y9ASR0_9MICO|nr:DUF3566 domain-containing protein [Georgenia satyanarayanai]PYF97757.1 transmembrane protein DUF3566 [Georgenia satyanarayanai]SSA45497.1 Transmembrane protein of unknown function [Georgenia satyanarayanai]
MSSTTPGQGGAGDVTPPEGESPRPAQQDRAAMRTSLAERFAAARGVEEHPVVPRPDDTAPVSTTATSHVRPGSSGVAGGSAAAPRYGATATSSSGPATAPQPAAQPAERETRTAPAADDPRSGARPAAGPRRVRLSVARVDPWSVMKLSFLLSIAVGIGIVVAAAAMWFVLDSMHVFADVEELLVTLDSENFLRLMDYVQLDRVMSMAAIIAVVDVLLLTALSTLGAFLYNIVAALVGGVHLTLTDD